MGLVILWTIISIIYVMVAFLSPLLEYSRIPFFNASYLFLRTSCHQIPDRCFWLWGSNMGLCAKCLGFYMTQPLVLLLAFNPFNRDENPRFLLPLSIILFLQMAADSTVLHFSMSNPMRFGIGFCGGIGLALLLTKLYYEWRVKMDSLWTKRKVLIVAGTVILHLLSMHRISSAQEKQYVTLTSGTPVMLEFLDTVTSETYSQGETVPVIVSRAVSVNDHVVIPVNSQVHAKIATAEKASGWGGEGKITINVESCNAIDGQKIMLSGGQSAEGASKHGAATTMGVSAGVCCLPMALTGFAVKGEEGQIPIGMTIKVRVDSDYQIAVLTDDEVISKQNELAERTRQLNKQIEEERENRIKEKRREQKPK